MIVGANDSMAGSALRGGRPVAAAILARDARQEGAPLLRVFSDARLQFVAWQAVLAVASGLGEALRVAGVLSRPAGFVRPICLLAFGYLVMVRAGARRAGTALRLAGMMRGFAAIFGIQPGAKGTG